MEQIVSVEETQIKDKKCILLRFKGGKQFVLQCEVSASVGQGGLEMSGVSHHFNNSKNRKALLLYCDFQEWA